ncbi:MAG: gluconate 2-dehydrogenase subunit 3 family protein [Terriglobia bacterium]
MKRRTALKMVALTALPTGLASTRAQEDKSAAQQHTSLPQLQFFTQDEYKLLDGLTEMIIPADSHSLGAQAAQVSLFADRMLATSNDQVKAQWREGLGLIREDAARSSLGAALAKAAANEQKPQTKPDHFFVSLKRMTVNGYYTSAIGIHQDLQYQGNTYLPVFAGCTDRAIKD